MESTSSTTNKVSLKDVTSFITKQSDDKDPVMTIEERTNYAINLLQSLPCARYAVLEKIGEVFFDEAQRYIVDLERQHLAGMPAISELVETNHDIQIKKIKEVLVSSIESNSKAWAPVIFQWAVQTCSQICGQYGINRHFSTLTIQERTQMWLACAATNNLIGIVINCLQKIIHKNKENCLKCLLQATLAYTPFFNWALAHICCAFPDIVPEVFLKHALSAFSNQSRKSEVIKETMLNIFELVIPTSRKHIQDAIYKLFMTSLVDVKETKKTDEREILCVIPFLLNVAVNQVNIFVPIVDKVLDTITIEHLSILHEQSKLRDDVLQRGVVRRTVNCVKMMDGCTYKMLQCLIKYACMEDKELCKDNPDLAKSVQSVCFVILESLLLTLKHEVYIYIHHVKEAGSLEEETVNKIPFLISLSTYTKQCCRQLITSSGTKKEILQDFIILMAIQEGRDKMKEILSLILVNAPMTSNKSTLKACMNEFELTEVNNFQETLEDIFNNINSSSIFSETQISTLLKNLLHHMEDESEDNKSALVLDQVRKHAGTFAKLLITCQPNQSVINDIFEILKLMSSEDLRLSEYADIVQSIICVFFKTLKSMNKTDDLEKNRMILKDCEDVLVSMVTNHKSLQQYVIGLLVEEISSKGEIETFSSEPEEPTIKTDLINKNYSMAEDNRIHNNATSILFKDGLKLNKRKSEEPDLEQLNIFRQYFMGTLFSMLAINPGYSSPRSDEADDKKYTTFLSEWGDSKFSRPFPSAYAYVANLLVEKVCPECVPVCPWPDEEFLKYTIERDLKVKKKFDENLLYWDILQLVSTARPSLYQCSVLIQSLFGMSLKFWKGNRNQSSTSTPMELKSITRLLYILKLAGWLPSEFDSISDILPFIKPKEVYNILSALWKYFKVNNYSPDRFIDRDTLGRPQHTSNPEHLQIVRSVIKIVFFQNISKIGHMCKRFLSEHTL